MFGSHFAATVCGLPCFRGGADETLRNWTCSACHSVGFTLSAGTTRLVRQARTRVRCIEVVRLTAAGRCVGYGWRENCITLYDDACNWCSAEAHHFPSRESSSGMLRYIPGPSLSFFRPCMEAELGEADSTFIFAARMKWLEGEHSQHAWPPARPRESLKNPKEDTWLHRSEWE